MKLWWALLFVLPICLVMAQHAGTNLEETPGVERGAANARVRQKQDSASQELPIEQRPDLDLLAQPVQVMQPVESAELIPLELPPKTPAESLKTVHGFCCYYSPDANNPCGNCQARDSRAWNADPSNCGTSGGSYCSGVVGLFGIDDMQLAAINRQRTFAAIVPFPDFWRVFGYGAACGFVSVMVAFALVYMRRPLHDYTLLSSTDHLLMVSEVQESCGDSRKT